MLSISAPLTSLTTYIVPDGECLHFSAANIQIPSPSNTLAPTPVSATLTILPAASPQAVHTRLSRQTGLSQSDIAHHLGAINTQCPFFCLVNSPATPCQRAELHLPVRHYNRLQTTIHKVGPLSHLSFPVPLSHTLPAVRLLESSHHPDPLSILFFLEHKLLCHSLEHLEIAIAASTLPHLPALPCFSRPELQGA